MSVEVGRLLERQSDIERISIIIDQQPVLLEARRMEDAADDGVDSIRLMKVNDICGMLLSSLNKSDYDERKD